MIHYLLQIALFQFLFFALFFLLFIIFTKRSFLLRDIRYYLNSSIFSMTRRTIRLTSYSYNRIELIRQQFYSTSTFSITRFFLILTFSRPPFINFNSQNIAAIILLIQSEYLLFFSLSFSSLKQMLYLFAVIFAIQASLYKLIFHNNTFRYNNIFAKRQSGL